MISKKSKHISEVIPLMDVVDNCPVLQDGRAAICFELRAEEIEKREAQGYQKLAQVFAAAIKSLPVGAVIQKLDIYDHVAFDRYDKSGQEAGYFEKKAAHHFFERPLLFQRSILCLSLGKTGQVGVNAISNFFAYGKNIFPNPFEEIESRIQAVQRLGAELSYALGGQGIGVKRLLEKELKKLYLQYVNLSFSKEPKSLERKLHPHAHGMALGEKSVRIISLSGQGDRVEYYSEQNGVAAPWVGPLLSELNFPHILSTTLRVEDREKSLSSLDLEKRINGSLAFLSTQDNSLKEAEIDAFTEEIRSEHEMLTSLSLQLVLWNSDLNVLQSQTEKSLSAIRAMAGSSALVESIDTTALFFAIAPGNAFQNYRWLLMGLKQAAAYFHFTAPYQSAKEGVLLSDRKLRPLLVELFSSRQSNQNAIVVGPSGSGKSFTVGSFIIQRFEQGHRQIIIDVGGTYQNTLTALEGKYFTYDPAYPLSFNPFLIEGELTGDKLSFLTALLALIWKGNKGLSQAERSVLSKLIPLYYEEEKAIYRLDRFYTWLEAYDKKHKTQESHKKLKQSFALDEFLLVLEPFVSGKYKHVLTADTDISLHEYPLICFDMAKVKSNQMLYPIVALLISELALDQIRKFPNERKYLYMDEAWSMLSDSMGEFVELMYRTIRKNKGSMCIITQGVGEIVDSTVGQAILANADSQIILQHTDESKIKLLEKVFGFTSHELAKIRSLEVKEHYREIFIRQGEYGKVYALEVSPAMAAALSSRPDERNRILELLEEKGNIRFALNEYLEEKFMKTV